MSSSSDLRQTSNRSLSPLYKVFMMCSCLFSCVGVIAFTLLCGFTYDVGMSDKYGGLRTSTVYSANVTNYIACETNDFNTYAPVASFERFGQVVNCVLLFSGGTVYENCKAFNELSYVFPYGSSIDLYLNTEKIPYCVTKNYLEENAHLGFQFLITDIVFVMWLIISVIIVCYDTGYFTFRSQSNANNLSVANV